MTSRSETTDSAWNLTSLGRWIGQSRWAPIAALPLRIRTVSRYDARVLGQSYRWLRTSREYTNFTYDLTPLNKEHLAWWIASIARVPVARVRGYIGELDTDGVFVEHLMAAARNSDRRGVTDAVPRPGRRLGWYALIRCLQPEHVVETGTDKGLGSCVAAAALLRNGNGRLTTVDKNPNAGFLVVPPYSNVTELHIGESLDILHGLSTPVDLFLQESWGTFEHEVSELEEVTPHLGERAVVLNGRPGTYSLAHWAERTDRRFLYFHAQPNDHWYRGDGIGAAW
jgi:hypothetical protein